MGRTAGDGGGSEEEKRKSGPLYQLQQDKNIIEHSGEFR